MRDPTLNQIRAAAILGATVAILATSFRLALRIRRKTLWWDDAWAFISMSAIVIFLTGMLIFTSNPDAHPHDVKIAAYYMVDEGFYGVIWSARVSILLTVVRLSYGRFRKLLKCVVVLFIMTWSVLFSQVLWTCEGEPSWKDKPIPQCALGTKVAIAQLITDCFCDLVLIICPTYLFYNMTNKKSLKIRLIAIFSSTIFTTIFSLAHAYAILRLSGLMEFMLAVIELVVSLIVVNLTVIAGWVFRIKDDQESRPSDHMNTFLKGRFSAGRSSKGRHETTTVGLTTFGPANASRIQVNVDTVRAYDGSRSLINGEFEDLKDPRQVGDMEKPEVDSVEGAVKVPLPTL